MMRVLLLITCLMFAACGGYRNKTHLKHELPSAGETAYLLQGDYDRGLELLSDELDKNPSVLTAFLKGDLLDAIGRPEEALISYFEALVIAHRTGQNPGAAVASATAVTAIRDRVERFETKYKQFLDSIEENPGKLHPEAWFQLMNLKFGLLRMKGMHDAANEVLKDMGCPQRWKAVGPVGPWTWKIFDHDERSIESVFKNEKYDLGAGRGIHLSRDLEAESCFLSVENPSMLLGGVTWIKTNFDVEKAGVRKMRLHTSEAVSLIVNGKEVLRRDPRKTYISRVSWIEVQLPAGRTEVVLKIASEREAPIVSLSMYNAADAVVNDIPYLNVYETLDDYSAPGEFYGKMKWSMWNDDMESARLFYLKAFKNVGREVPAALLSEAERIASDASMPADLAYEKARPMLVEALRQENRLWQAAVGLADREYRENRYIEALGILTDIKQQCPEEVSVLRRMAAIFFGRDWLAEAEETVEKIARLMPSACSTVDWKLASARKRLRFEEARNLAEQSVRCNVFSEYKLEELRRANDYEGAMIEADRLLALSTKSYSAALETAMSAIAAGNNESGIESLRRATQLAPTETGAAVALADALSVRGKKEEALSVLKESQKIPFAYLPALLDAEAAMKGQPLSADYRIDGRKALNEYLTENPQYNSSAAYVLDRAVYTVNNNGNVVMLVHCITHIKTDEAVEKHGELSIPEGANLLKAFTIKADGRVLEPQVVQGKDTLSMPDLESGDFIEYEYITSMYPNQLFPGGFDTERFYFQDFETAFHRTEMIVVLPKGMPFALDPRGDCPSVQEELKDNYKVLTWKTRNASPRSMEPLSPSASEFLPSIRVVAGATWENLFKRISEQLEGKDRIGYIVKEAVHEALHGIAVNDHKARKKALYYWVTKNIEPSKNMFEEAGHIIARKVGNRTRAFAAMLKAAGYSSRLALIMPAGEDETATALPSISRYYVLAAEVEGDGLVDLGSEFVPYGYLPALLRNRPFRYVDNGKTGSTDFGRFPLDTQDVEISFSLSDNGDVKGEIIEHLKGAAAAQWRESLEKIKASDQNRMFLSAYLSKILPGAELKSLDIKGLKDPESDLILKYEVAVLKFASLTDGKRMNFRLPFSENLAKQTGGVSSRNEALIVAMYSKKRVSVEIVLPPQWRPLQNFETDGKVNSEWGYATKTINTTKSSTQVESVSKTQVIQKVLKSKFEIDISAGRIPVEKYTEFLGFVKQADRVSDIKFELIPDEQSK